MRADQSRLSAERMRQSRIFSEHAFKKASEPKELYIVPGAEHIDRALRQFKSRA